MKLSSNNGKRLNNKIRNDHLTDRELGPWGRNPALTICPIVATLYTVKRNVCRVFDADSIPMWGLCITSVKPLFMWSFKSVSISTGLREIEIEIYFQKKETDQDFAHRLCLQNIVIYLILCLSVCLSPSFGFSKLQLLIKYERLCFAGQCVLSCVCFFKGFGQTYSVSEENGVELTIILHARDSLKEHDHFTSRNTSFRSETESTGLFKRASPLRRFRNNKPVVLIQCKIKRNDVKIRVS